MNPEPALNTEARREFDNEKREQEKEKQLRLGNMPKFSTAPTPRGPWISIVLRYCVSSFNSRLLKKMREANVEFVK